MSPALHAFLHSLIDYAGLFPPARLALDPALHNYARYRQHADRWMLGRFILPAARLAELDALSDLFTQAPPFSFSVLGHAELPEVEALRRTVADARTAEAHHDGQIVVESFEFKLSASLAADPARLAELFAAFREECGPDATDRAFFEVSLLGADWRCDVDTVAQAVAAHNAKAGREALGVKLRCGGVTPEVFPTTEALACALAACHEAGVPFKATAGLHHPVRHVADEVGAMMHGFLNVFGAAILVRVHDLDRATLERMLLDEAPDHFHFDTDGFSWMDWGALPEQIEEARVHFATSYGSCSFEEPREDLQALGLLEPTITA